MALKRPEWEKLIEQWRSSRQSARQFAMAHGVTDTALRYWAGRLQEIDDAAKTKPGHRPTPATSSSPTLARVVRPGDIPAAGSGRIMVVLGKATIVVERDFDEAHLREVVRALSEAG